MGIGLQSRPGPYNFHCVYEFSLIWWWSTSIRFMWRVQCLCFVISIINIITWKRKINGPCKRSNQSSLHTPHHTHGTYNVSYIANMNGDMTDQIEYYNSQLQGIQYMHTYNITFSAVAKLCGFEYFSLFFSSTDIVWWMSIVDGKWMRVYCMLMNFRMSIPHNLYNLCFSHTQIPQ